MNFTQIKKTLQKKFIFKLNVLTIESSGIFKMFIITWGKVLNRSFFKVNAEDLHYHFDVFEKIKVTFKLCRDRPIVKF